MSTEHTQPESEATNRNGTPGPDRFSIPGPDHSVTPECEVDDSLPPWQPPGKAVTPPALAELPDYELRTRAVAAWQRAGAIIKAVDWFKTYELRAVPFLHVNQQYVALVPTRRNREEELRYGWSLTRNLKELCWLRISSASFTGRTVEEVWEHFRPEDVREVFLKATEWQETLEKEMPTVVEALKNSPPIDPMKPPRYWHRDKVKVNAVSERLDRLWHEMVEFRDRLVLNPRAALTPPADDVPSPSGPRSEESSHRTPSALEGERQEHEVPALAPPAEQPVPMTLLVPNRYLKSWSEVLDAVGLPKTEEKRRYVRQANAKYEGPIILPSRGGQPFVEREKLLTWWNELEKRVAEAEQKRVNTRATLQDQHNHGRDGTVLPGISGHIQRRREDCNR